MSAWTPKIVGLSKFSPELDALLRQSFLELDARRQSRTASNQWEQEIVENILGDNQHARVCGVRGTRNWTKYYKQISHIYNWLEESTGLRARALPATDALQYLVETKKLIYYGQEADTQRLLAAAQKRIDYFLVSFQLCAYFIFLRRPW